MKSVYPLISGIRIVTGVAGIKRKVKNKVRKKRPWTTDHRRQTTDDGRRTTDDKARVLQGNPTDKREARNHSIRVYSRVAVHPNHSRSFVCLIFAVLKSPTNVVVKPEQRK